MEANRGGNIQILYFNKKKTDILLKQVKVCPGRGRSIKAHKMDTCK